MPEARALPHNRKRPDEQTLAKLYAEKSNKEIAETYGVAVNTVCHWVRKQGLVRTQEQADKIKDARRPMLQPVLDGDGMFVPQLDGFGRDLERFMAFRKISGNQLAKNIGINATTVYAWVNGRQLPTMPLFMKLCEALEAEPAFLFGFMTEQDYDYKPGPEHKNKCRMRTGRTRRDNMEVNP